jgi:hypothetical protein
MVLKGIKGIYRGENGKADGIRTHDLLTASQAFSQLNYSPTQAEDILPKHEGKVKSREFPSARCPVPRRLPL